MSAGGITWYLSKILVTSKLFDGLRYLKRTKLIHKANITDSIESVAFGNKAKLHIVSNPKKPIRSRICFFILDQTGTTTSSIQSLTIFLRYSVAELLSLSSRSRSAFCCKINR